MDRTRLGRRRFLYSTVAVLGILAGCRGQQGTASPSDVSQNGTANTEEPSTGPTDDQGLGSVELRGEPLATGFASPVAVEIDRTGRLFVVDQPGQVHMVDDEGRRESPFLDVSDRIVPLSGYTEQGLLGLAFHPNYSDNGRFFVRYTSPPRSGTPEDYSHTFVLSEFTAEPSAGTVEPDSETVLLEIPEPQSNHNAGSIEFGPDGYLYVGVGDGGGGGDQGTGHVEDWYDAVDGGNGQDVTQNLLGSVLRLDVDGQRDGKPYAVPDDNPLVGGEGLDEQYAWGFRNPWRMSFGPDGRLFVADVGGSAFEEVNVVEKGGNYGWNVREGTHCYSRDDCPSETPDGNSLRPPIIEYPHDGAQVSGISVIGGYLYDGDRIPALNGTYVFADWRAQGQLFVARQRSEGLWPVSAVPVENVGPYVLSFGRDGDGELLVCSSEDGNVDGSSGAVYRLLAA